jgi:hypothetical protein
MNAELNRPLDTHFQAALAELQGTLMQHYPAATFRLRRDVDDPGGIQLLVTVDTDDTDAVLDVVIDRVMELQIEEGLPVHVIPLRTTERVAALRKAYAATAPAWRRLGPSAHPEPTLP